MSPRRSSRARLTQPPLGGSNHSGTSSTASSARGDRSTRANAKSEEQIASGTPRSVSSDEAEGPDPTAPESRRTRQSRRDVHEADRLDDIRNDTVVEAEDADDEGVTRCICGLQEYPGPQYELADIEIEGLGPLSEDAGALFIQCDVCEVWQHGGCVGILDEAMSPENYYCEECRKDLHTILFGRTRYSLYNPVKNKIRRRGGSARDSDPRSPKDNDTRAQSANAMTQSAKRRSTMNSRAAYDEEEVMRRVIEESKGEGASGSTVNGSRKTKRGRDESEDALLEVKRRKTGSESGTPPDGRHGTIEAGDSDTERRRSIASRKRNPRDNGQVWRELDLRERELDKEVRAEIRADAAGRRKGRAERRRMDESEPPEDISRGAAGVKSGGMVSKAAKSQGSSRPGTEGSPLHPSATTSSSQNKKNGRPSRRGRLGRNQYTKERDAAVDSGLTSPHPSHSRDEDEHGVAEGDEMVNGLLVGNGSKPSRPRVMNPLRTSMNDMKRRVAGILEYISRTQVEMAGERLATPSASTAAAGGAHAAAAAGKGSNGITSSSKLSHEINGAGDEVAGDAENGNGNHGDGGRGSDENRGASELSNGQVDEGEFTKLNSLDMMDVLTRELVHWQKEHGKWR